MSRYLSTVLVSLMIVTFTARRAAAQQAASASKHQHASPVRVVSIRYATGAGLCGCYCGSEIQVSPGQARLFLRPFRDCQQQNPEKYREFRVNADLSNKHWHELQALVDHDALFGLPETIGCPGCTDGLIQSLEIAFSDHTRKSVSYGSAPAAINSLSEKLSALQEKLGRELPPNVPKD